jgi:hypothetical protein
MRDFLAWLEDLAWEADYLIYRWRWGIASFACGFSSAIAAFTAALFAGWF